GCCIFRFQFPPAVDLRGVAGGFGVFQRFHLLFGQLIIAVSFPASYRLRTLAASAAAVRAPWRERARCGNGPYQVSSRSPEMYNEPLPFSVADEATFAPAAAEPDRSASVSLPRNGAGRRSFRMKILVVVAAAWMVLSAGTAWATSETLGIATLE